MSDVAIMLLTFKLNCDYTCNHLNWHLAYLTFHIV